MPSSRPAECHPDKHRKTADGLCDTCYRRRRYRQDAEHRERVLASHRRPPRTPETRECPCGQQFTTTVHNKTHCSLRCMKRESRHRRSATTRPPKVIQAAHLPDGTTLEAVTYQLDTGGVWVYCPQCGTMAGIEGPNRWCPNCPLTFRVTGDVPACTA